MRITLDTSALLSVLLAEPARDTIVRLTRGAELLAPAALHWELGNALSALIKRKRLTKAEALKVLAAYRTIPLRFVDVSLGEALTYTEGSGLYAYDAYFIVCALGQRTPLLTVDRRLAAVAEATGVKVLEVE